MRRCIQFVVGAQVLFRLAGAADTAPDWLHQLAQAPLPAYARNIPAVVLLDEKSVTVDAAGRVVSTRRYALRILLPEGRRYAEKGEFYTTDTGRVLETQAWLIQPSGEVKRYRKDKVLDVPLAGGGDMYSNVHYRLIDASNDGFKGSIFGYESVKEDKSVFTQFSWYFQEHLPVIVSHFRLTLPQGWRVDSVTHNHDRVEPAATPGNWTWELRDLPAIEQEPASPQVSSLAPRVEVSFFPPPGDSAGLGRSFAGWRDVSRWLSELADPQADPDDAITRKARDLTASAKTEYERIQAIGQFVQNVRYVSIQTGLGRGGGYRPHAAAEVFAKSYGDCKDKANLMRAMLKAVGIASYPLVIFSGDRTYVREDWPSPQQFNHCILATRLTQQVSASTTIEHPSLGQLLIFDPTDDSTPVGELPEIEQDSLALLVAGDQGALMRMPGTSPSANRVERHAELTLSAEGSIRGSVREKSWGKAGVDARRRLHHVSQADYRSMVEKWITSGGAGAVISRVQPADDFAGGTFTLEVDFEVPRYAQFVQNRLLLVKPAVAPRRDRLVLSDGVRKHPVALNRQALRETERIHLPAGFAVDELPDPVSIETSFGKFQARMEIKDGAIASSRELTVLPVVLPAERYPEVRAFFETVLAAEQAQVVLVRK